MEHAVRLIPFAHLKDFFEVLLELLKIRVILSHLLLGISLFINIDLIKDTFIIKKKGFALIFQFNKVRNDIID